MPVIVCTSGNAHYIPFPWFKYSAPASDDRPTKEKITIAALQAGEHPPEISTPQCITDRSPAHPPPARSTCHHEQGGRLHRRLTA